jgi:hypothetical protein
MKVYIKELLIQSQFAFREYQIAQYSIKRLVGQFVVLHSEILNFAL